MRISELIGNLSSKFPNQASNIEAWLPEYRTALERFEGERLAEAYTVCMTGWKAGWAPRPADISEHLPVKIAAVVNDQDWALWRKGQYETELASIAAKEKRYGVPYSEATADVQKKLAAHCVQYAV